MKKTVMMVGAFLAGCCMALHAQEAKTLFVNMPDSISPLLTAVNRADCVDFMESNMKAEVTNALGGKSQMTFLSADYIRVQSSARSLWQMKLLAVDDTTRVICTVSTVSAPVPDSRIAFYSLQWKQLPLSEYLPGSPVLDDFIQEAGDTTDVYAYQEARRQADMLLVQADLSPKNDSLSFTLTTPRYMEKEAADKLRPFIRRSLVYAWKQGRYVPASTLP